MKIITKIMALFLSGAFCLAACAEKPDGTFVMNEETIENFFDSSGALKSWDPPSSLNLLLKQPVVKADLPPIPADAIRVYGTLDSVGQYRTTSAANATFANADLRGSTFEKSVYGMLGPAGSGGNAWFYADINARTGNIEQGRAYLYGFNGGVCDLRQPVRGSWGQIGPDSFTIAIGGYCAFPTQEGATFQFELLIAGDTSLMSRQAGQEFSARYIVDNSGNFASIPQKPEDNPQIYDYGAVQAQVER